MIFILAYFKSTIVEYGPIFFCLLAIIVATVDYFTFIWKWADLLKFVENCERFIEQRKLHSTHISDQITRFSSNLFTICEYYIAGGKELNAYKTLNAHIKHVNKHMCYAHLMTLLSFILFPISYTGVGYNILDWGKDIRFICILQLSSAAP